MNISQSLIPAMTLKQILENQKATSTAKYAPERTVLYEKGIREIDAAGITENAIQDGQTAPDFALTNAKGKNVSLYDQLKNGPVVLTWYRGGWCPYCNLTLRELQKHLPQFKELNATLLALTPELPDKSLSTKEKNELEFEVLSDLDNVMARAYGLVFTLPADVAESYSNSFSMLEYNGNDTKELPLPATYVIDREGKVRYAYLAADYRTRAEPEDILEVLRKLQ